MPCFVEAVWASSLHHPSAQHKAASEISSCLQRQWVKLIQALAALIKPHEGRKRQGSASHTQAMGIVPALLLIERWVANEAGHTALSLETQRHRSTPTSHPLSPEVERENVKKIENFAWVGMNVGVGSHPSRPSAGCSYRLSGHIRVCRQVCRPPGTVWHPLQTCLTIFYFSSVFFCYTTD